MGQFVEQFSAAGRRIVQITENLAVVCTEFGWYNKYRLTLCVVSWKGKVNVFLFILELVVDSHFSPSLKEEKIMN